MLMDDAHCYMDNAYEEVEHWPEMREQAWALLPGWA